MHIVRFPEQVVAGEAKKKRETCFIRTNEEKIAPKPNRMHIAKPALAHIARANSKDHINARMPKVE